MTDTKNPRTISLKTARRLAISKQHLARAEQDATAGGMLEVVKDLGCLQLDPISVVARSHTLVMFSRVGPYDTRHLDRLIYHDRRMFEYWAHAASIVLTEDYPIHALRMRTYAKLDDPWHRRIAKWIDDNRTLRDTILREIRRNGPISSRVLTESGIAPKSWVSSGWTNDRNVSRMIDFLWMQGRIMVANRQGLNKFWDLSERVLPEWTPRERLTEREVVRRAAVKSLRALGVGTERHISLHYIAGRYPDLRTRLGELEADGEIERVEIADLKNGKRKEPWYIQRDDVPRLDAIERGEWEGRTVTLSPFDNLIRDRVRNIALWDYDYKIEIYTPQHKRKYGYYVLTLLHNDELIGRFDPAMDRARGILKIHAVHAEPGARRDAKTGRAVRDAIEELGEFLGANEIQYTDKVPEGWKRALK